jgi:hypothetical protein
VPGCDQDDQDNKGGRAFASSFVSPEANGYKTHNVSAIDAIAAIAVSAFPMCELVVWT